MKTLRKNPEEILGKEKLYQKCRLDMAKEGICELEKNINRNYPN